MTTLQAGTGACELDVCYHQIAVRRLAAIANGLNVA